MRTPSITSRFQRIVAAALLLLLPGAAQAQWLYYIENGRVTVYLYQGLYFTTGIPTSMANYPVTGVGDWTFHRTLVTSVSIPVGITYISPSAFYGANSLTTIKVSAQNPDFSNGMGSARFQAGHPAAPLPFTLFCMPKRIAFTEHFSDQG